MIRLLFTLSFWLRQLLLILVALIFFSVRVRRRDFFGFFSVPTVPQWQQNPATFPQAIYLHEEFSLLGFSCIRFSPLPFISSNFTLPRKGVVGPFNSSLFCVNNNSALPSRPRFHP